MQSQLYKKMYQLEKENWWFKARRKILLPLIKDTIKNNTSLCQILDVGCGTGIMLQHLTNLAQPIGVDISPQALEFCRQRKLSNTMLGKAENLPLKSDSFDMVLALDTIEHIKKDQQALQEFYRVLKPGGHLLLTVPALPILWSSHDVIHQHFRRYSKHELVDKIRLSKLKINKISFINTILFLPAFAFRFLNGSLNKIGIFSGHTDLVSMPKMINQTLYYIFGFESLLLKFTNLPIGITLMVIAQKPDK